MARTPLAGAVQDAVATVASGERRTTRTRFVKEAGAAAIGLTALGRLAAPARGATAPKIVVVGAGLAGLSAAYALRSAGHIAEIHEASDRIGGRCWTRRGEFADGQIAEHGGELIDQSHSHIRHLAQGLGLKLENLLQAEQNGTELIALLRRLPVLLPDEMSDDIKAAWQKIHADVSAASYPTTFETLHRARPRARQHVDRRLDRGDVRGRDRLTDRPAARRRLQHRVRRRVAPSRARSTCSICSPTRGQGHFRVFGPRTRSTASSAATTGSRTGSPLRCRPDHDRVRAGRGAPQRHGNVHAHLRPAAPGRRRSPRTRSCSRCRSRSSAPPSTSRRPGSSRSSWSRSASRAWARTRSCTSSSRAASGARLGAERRDVLRHGLPEHAGR